MIILYVLLGLIVVIGLLVIAMYNGLIRLKNRVDEAWSDIDVQLKRRYDLIPNLVETVKGYAAHEQATFEKVIQARNAAMSAQASGDAEARGKAEETLSGTLKSIFALAIASTFLGFAGSPWTVATYMVAGEGSRDQHVTREYAYRNPAAFGAIVEKARAALA